ncbi:hypothetical protein [Amycolatopsis rubida]|nr:hypothetical protein [Amycolatopsis rubida]
MRLRSAIAETLWDCVKAHHLEAACDALGMAPAREGSAEPFNSKRSYVEGRLQGMSLTALADLGYRVAAEYVPEYLQPVLDALGAHGVAGELKNLIFAADGPKPEIVFRDALNNDVLVVKNEQFCLVYDRPLAAHGLTWADLTNWWADHEGLTGATAREVSLSLYRRLDRALGNNEAERRILRAYADRYVQLGDGIPALIPQVYLHYDPYTRTHRAPGLAPLPRQRMDFLLLLPQRIRIVIECDGRQHYTDKTGRGDSQKYAEMVAEDRELRLRGYEVYRFGGAELVDTPAASQRLTTFFDRLAERHAT